MTQLFLLYCPHCKHRMKYQSKTRILAEKRKQCVFCGKSYKARDHIIKEL